MREVRRSALVPYTPLKMYALVNDVAGYPAFVPFCPAATVLESSATSLTARLDIARAGLRVSLTTRNSLVPGESIQLALVDGPFKALEGRWDFVPLKNVAGEVRGCRIELLVRFEFRSAALGLVASPLFEATWDRLVDAFVKRSREVYGG